MVNQRRYTHHNSDLAFSRLDCDRKEKISMALTPFHIAIQVRNMPEAQKFYKDVLGCCQGRSSDTWADFNLYGHQLVCHLNPNIEENEKIAPCYNLVDGHKVPVPHFGVILEMEAWKVLAHRLKQHAIDFIISPYIRFEGEVGEQATLFLKDPSGNALEFKAFKSSSQIFASSAPF